MKTIQDRTYNREELSDLFEEVDILFDMINPRKVKITFEEMRNNKYKTKIYVSSKDYKRRCSG